FEYFESLENHPINIFFVKDKYFLFKNILFLHKKYKIESMETIHSTRCTVRDTQLQPVIALFV
ncbi:MAG: hypothetical protein LBV75_07160, partial [Paludibacter sp.]|nr:hypothetical protein [Paludibacter sp.]